MIKKLIEKIAIFVFGQKKAERLYLLSKKIRAGFRDLKSNNTGSQTIASTRAPEIPKIEDAVIFLDAGFSGGSNLDCSIGREVLKKIVTSNPAEDFVLGPDLVFRGARVSGNVHLVVLACSPLDFNARLFLKAAKPSNQSTTDDFSESLPTKIPAKTMQSWIGSQVVDHFCVEHKKIVKIGSGVGVASSDYGNIFLVSTDSNLTEVSDAISSYLEEPFRIFYGSGAFCNKSISDISDLRGRGLPKSYVATALDGPLIRRFLDEEDILKSRLDWENSVAAKRIRKEITLAEFGREIQFETDSSPEAPRTFEAEGEFVHKERRENIAISKFWSAEASHPDDINDFEDREYRRVSNYNYWKSDELERIRRFRFSPKMDVLVEGIEVAVRDLPIENYRFLLGDGCLYFGPSKSAGFEGRPLPGASEAHCTAISLRGSSDFDRRVGFPREFPLLVTKHEAITTPQHFARHFPHKIRKEDLDAARVRVRISYRPLQAGQKAHKFVRIPYLDQYPDAPILIQENRSWYKPWDKNEPLVVRGFSVYFSPKPPQLQSVSGVRIFALDRFGRPVPGKEISLDDIVVGGDSESLSLGPSFIRGDLVIEDGETLSASGYLTDGTPSADMSIFVLIEIPESRLNFSYGSPLFYSQGCANLSYLTSLYPQDRLMFNSTPAATDVLDNLATTPISPWAEKLGLREVPQDISKKLQVYDEASSLLFVD